MQTIDLAPAGAIHPSTLDDPPRRGVAAYLALFKGAVPAFTASPTSARSPDWR